MKKRSLKVRKKLFLAVQTLDIVVKRSENVVWRPHISKEPILQNANFRNRQTLFYLTEVDW